MSRGQLLPQRPWTAVEDACVLGISGTEAAQEAALEALAQESGRSKSEVRYRRRWLVWASKYEGQQVHTHSRRPSTRWSGR